MVYIIKIGNNDTMSQKKTLKDDTLSENRSDMKKGTMGTTPDWNDKDLAKCRIYDEAVKAGKMTYRTIEIN